MAGGVIRAALAGAAVLLVFAAVALAAPGDPQRRFTAADQARARAFVLGAADIPGGPRGWKTVMTDFSQANPPCVVKHYSLSKLVETGEAGLTHTYGGGVLALESDAHVFRTAGDAASAFRTSSKLGLGRCLGAFLAAGLEKASPQVHARVVRVAPFTLKGLGVQAGGFRVDTVITAGKATIPNTVLQLNLLRGRSLASIGFVSTGGPWPAAAIRTLAAKAALRMKRS